MEREIKLRGKRISNGKWLYGDLTHDNVGGCYVFPIDCAALYKENAILPETIGQYTGLKDKNGKEIYEGDILRVEEFKNESDSIEKSEEFYEVFDLEDMKGEKIREYITPVCWEYGTFAISVSQENDTYLDVLFGDMRRSFPIFIFEIIGNIHDNPELLKDGRD